MPCDAREDRSLFGRPHAPINGITSCFTLTCRERLQDCVGLVASRAGHCTRLGGCFPPACVTSVSATPRALTARGTHAWHPPMARSHHSSSSLAGGLLDGSNCCSRDFRSPIYIDGRARPSVERCTCPHRCHCVSRCGWRVLRHPCPDQRRPPNDGCRPEPLLYCASGHIAHRTPNPRSGRLSTPPFDSRAGIPTAEAAASLPVSCSVATAHGSRWRRRSRVVRRLHTRSGAGG
jgi:hypothetical protein